MNKKAILHIDFNSYFASVEQQANPHLRGKPIGVTGGDRMKRTVLGAASVDAKKFGVKTGMQIWEAKKLCPQIIIVPGDSDKYLETTKRFLNILKDYSPNLEVFSIDEAFLEIPNSFGDDKIVNIAQDIKKRIKVEIGEYITCSIGISYNKLMAKLAGSLKKPDGLVIIASPEEAVKVLDRVELDDICGIGFRIKKRLNNMGVSNFKELRNVPLQALLASFKSYGQTLYNMSRGIDHLLVEPFYEKGEVKSIGLRHTTDHDTKNEIEIKQIALKLTELIARKLRAKKLVAQTVHCWYRHGFRPGLPHFSGEGMQVTIPFTNNGLEIFKAVERVFKKIWDKESIRMIGVSVSNLKSQTQQTLSLLPESKCEEKIIQALDKINNKYGEFTLKRGILLRSLEIKQRPNSFLADRRFKI